MKGSSLRYAALCLAALWHQLGHREEAEQACREAISFAQVVQDHTCLQHSQSLLARLRYWQNNIFYYTSILRRLS